MQACFSVHRLTTRNTAAQIHWISGRPSRGGQHIGLPAIILQFLWDRQLDKHVAGVADEAVMLSCSRGLGTGTWTWTSALALSEASKHLMSARTAWHCLPLTLKPLAPLVMSDTTVHAGRC